MKLKIPFSHTTANFHTYKFKSDDLIVTFYISKDKFKEPPEHINVEVKL